MADPYREPGEPMPEPDDPYGRGVDEGYKRGLRDGLEQGKEQGLRIRKYAKAAIPLGMGLGVCILVDTGVASHVPATVAGIGVVSGLWLLAAFIEAMRI